MIEYRNVFGFVGYRVGSDGSVWTRWVRGGPVGSGRGAHHLGSEWKLMTATVHPTNGIPKVVLRRSGKGHTFSVCRLVLEAFVGPRPVGMECCHNNGNPADNRVENLRWDTRKGNAKDRAGHGRDTIGERNGRHKLTAGDIPNIVLANINGESAASIARRLGLGASTIREIIRGETWVHVKRPN